MKNSIKTSVYIGVAGLVVGSVGGYIASSQNAGYRFVSQVEEREVGNEYVYINPLLACGDQYFPKANNAQTLALETSISSYIAAQKASGKISDASVYFRELGGAFPVAINGDAQFTPGSMLKVPLAMSLYKKGHTIPGFLEQKILFEGGDNANALEHYTADAIQKGQIYTVEELIRAMLEHSDNNATLLLTQLIDQKQLNDAYEKLGIQVPEQGKDYTMPVKVYASFFRILYNSTYLDRDESEKLLGYLAAASFREGLVAGVAPGTRVAHKFGERQVAGQSTVQLHDCGLVYQGKQPYIICVMMRGSSYDVLAKNIAHISELAFNYARAR